MLGHLDNVGKNSIIHLRGWHGDPLTLRRTKDLMWELTYHSLNIHDHQFVHLKQCLYTNRLCAGIMPDKEGQRP